MNDEWQEDAGNLAVHCDIDVDLQLIADKLQFNLPHVDF